MAGSKRSFLKELAWNLHLNYFSKWFWSWLALLICSMPVITYFISLALLKFELITVGISVGVYLFIIGLSIAVSVAAVGLISVIHAAQYKHKGNLTVLGDFMGSFKLGQWLATPFKLFGTELRGALLNYEIKPSEAQIKLVAKDADKMQPKSDFVAVEITIFQLESEIRDAVSDLYEHLETHFKHRDLELLTYQNTISELGNTVDPEVELERKLLREEWDAIKSAATEADPQKFFDAINHYLDTTTVEIGEVEEMLDERYDLDEERNSLFFMSSSEKDTNAVREDLEIIHTHDRGGISHH